MATKAFDKLLDKATNHLLFEIDWDSVLKMCDMIRGGDVPGKYAVDKIKKKLANENNNVISFSLTTLESFVKNCGSKVHQEVATKDMMDQLRTLSATKPEVISNKVLELIQCWAHAFKKNPNYKIVDDYYNLMKLNGAQFPVLKESEAMFDVEEAPVWKEDTDATSCFKCRTNFSTFNRKHHCRACGEIFCGTCSAKTSPIPKFGIEKEVRVCDACYDKIRGLTPSSSANTLSQGETAEGLPIEYVNSPLYKEAKLQATKKPQEKSEAEFEEELQLALALSQSEAEENQRRKSGGGGSKTLNGKSGAKSKEDSNNKSAFDNDSSSQSAFPKLSQFQTNSNSSSSFQLPYASAPSLTDSSSSSKTKASNSNNSNSDYGKNGSMMSAAATINGAQRYEEAANLNAEEVNMNNEIDEFVEELKKILELYINRMKSDSMRGRSITNDTAVQSLFLQLQHYHPRLLQYIKYQEDARGHYENLQDKLTQLKDAREALNALRHENQEKKRLEAEERERVRQIQIAQKLQFMRQQKQSYYQYQSQLNLQRLQEQEREIQMRLEQQRQLAMMRDQQLLSANGLGYQQTMPGAEDYNSMAVNLPGGQQYQMAGLNGQSMPNMAMNPGATLNYPNYNMVPPQQQQQQLPQSNSLQQLVQSQQQIIPTDPKSMLNQHQHQYGQQFQALPNQMPPPPQQQQQQWNQQPMPNPAYQQQQQQQQLPPAIQQEPKPIDQSQLQLQQQQYQQQIQASYPAPSQANGIVAPPAPPAEAQLISFD